MARYSKTLTPAAQAAFLAELRGGALVVAAAASAGVAVSTLYCRRRRDSEFDSEWRAAAEASAGWVYEKRPGEKGRLVRAKRRLRFAGGRREAFLRGLELSCNTTQAARDSLVDPGTIYRHIRRDPDFARANKAALALGYERLEALAVEERAQAAERWARPIVPAEGVRPPADFETQMRLLHYWRRKPARVRASWRDRPARSFEETLALLELKLRHLPP